MDPVSTAVRAQVAAAITPPGGSTAEAERTLSRVCQSVLAKCRASAGPCPAPASRRAARRQCWELREAILPEYHSKCVGHAVKAKPKDAEDDEPAADRVERLTRRCSIGWAESDKRYTACLSAAVVDHAAACAVSQCSDAAAKCVERQQSR
jgi:hypothetical protein